MPILKRVLTPILALVILAAVVMIGGALLPEAHVASVSAAFQQPPETLWPTITDFASWPSWNPGVVSMERLADREGRAVWLLTDANGRIPTEIIEAAAPTSGRPGRLVTRIADPDLPFGGSWTWDIARSEDGCVVTITEAGEIYNPSFRFISRFVSGYTATAESFLRALGRKFGEEVKPVPEGG